MATESIDGVEIVFTTRAAVIESIETITDIYIYGSGGGGYTDGSGGFVNPVTISSENVHTKLIRLVWNNGQRETLRLPGFIDAVAGDPCRIVYARTACGVNLGEIAFSNDVEGREWSWLPLEQWINTNKPIRNVFAPHLRLMKLLSHISLALALFWLPFSVIYLILGLLAKMSEVWMMSLAVLIVGVSPFAALLLINWRTSRKALAIRAVAIRQLRKQAKVEAAVHYVPPSAAMPDARAV
jgi:hypothetical protein